MTRLAIEPETCFHLSLADAPKTTGEPNYTFDTLLSLREQFHPDSSLFCLMGADSFMALRYWRRSAEIPFLAPLVVASRPGQPLDDLRSALPEGLSMASASLQPPGTGEVEVRSFILTNRAGASAPFYLLPGLNVDVSASEIREQLRFAGDCQISGRQVIPTSVLDYIRAHGLYL